MDDEKAEALAKIREDVAEAGDQAAELQRRVEALNDRIATMQKVADGWRQAWGAA